VDTDGYFTSFRSDCGFPKSKKSPPMSSKEDGEEDKEMSGGGGGDLLGITTGSNESGTNSTENEYELFGKGSTSTTASSCGTVVLRSKPNPPARTTSVDHLLEKNKSQSVSSFPALPSSSSCHHHIQMSFSSVLFILLSIVMNCIRQEGKFGWTK
jgi:hypothetical protein